MCRYCIDIVALLTAETIRATEVHMILFCSLVRKGRTKMKAIWLTSLPEKIQAASWDLMPNCRSMVVRTEER